MEDKPTLLESRWKKRAGIAGVLIVVVLLVVVLNYRVDPKCSLTFDAATGNIRLAEAKCLWGGVWFRKDALVLSRDGFAITKDSLLFGSESVSVPFQKIKQVVFEEGLTINQMTIATDGSRYTFYIDDDIYFRYLEYVLPKYGDNRLTIIETASFLKSFGNSRERAPSRD